ncbi:MAG: hypothetical protein JRH20_26865, partial [Deltaproteobacteria bacterium]|nr:hypothetical protein [Deltaproteobacteria bacterium]
YARGKKIDDIACTNWATSAPIGELPRWVRRINSKTQGMQGVPAKVRNKGLYMALSEAKDGKARQRLVEKVLAAEGHTKWTYKAVKDLARRISRQLDDRPAPWVHQVDSILKKLAHEGAIHISKSVAENGLFHAMQAAKTPRGRKRIIKAVLSEGNLPQLHEKTRADISKLAQAFERDLMKSLGSANPLLKADFPARPADLPLRKSMAKRLNLGRSKDPAMWLTGLMLHPDTSVIAVFKGPEAFSSEMDFGLGIMGALSISGRMVKNPKVMAEKLMHPNKGAIAVSP